MTHGSSDVDIEPLLDPQTHLPPADGDEEPPPVGLDRLVIGLQALVKLLLRPTGLDHNLLDRLQGLPGAGGLWEGLVGMSAKCHLDACRTGGDCV